MYFTRIETESSSSIDSATLYKLLRAPAVKRRRPLVVVVVVVITGAFPIE